MEKQSKFLSRLSSVKPINSSVQNSAIKGWNGKENRKA